VSSFLTAPQHIESHFNAILTTEGWKAELAYVTRLLVNTLAQLLRDALLAVQTVTSRVNGQASVRIYPTAATRSGKPSVEPLTLTSWIASHDANHCATESPRN